MTPTFNWQQKDWPAFTFARGALRDELASLLRLVRNHPGRGVPFFLASVKASRATVERAVRALVRAGRIEHRGSRKTGGYFAKEFSTEGTTP